MTDSQQRDELIRGLLYTHNRANANTAQVHEANAAVQALIEVLEDAGVLDRAALEQHRRDARAPLCGAACCKLPLALSSEDVREGVLTWDTGRPYMMARGADHHCVHLDRQTRQCGVYGRRPIPCRGYDCRGDRRIWLDFDARIINPQINAPDWPVSLPPGGADTD